jgi:hypothetical protein
METAYINSLAMTLSQSHGFAVMNVLEPGIGTDVKKEVIVLSRSSLGAGAYSDP